MLRFLRSQFSPEQARPADDLLDFFQFSETVRSGFPSEPTAIAVDNVLSLVAIGTQTGDLYIFVGLLKKTKFERNGIQTRRSMNQRVTFSMGGENILWRSCIPTHTSISYLYFAHGTGFLMALCSNQTFHRFQIDGDRLDVQTVALETRLKRITSCEIYQKKDKTDSRLLIGTVTGNVFSIKMDTLELAEFILYEDTMLPRLPEGAKDNRTVDGIAVNPREPRQVLLVLDSKCIVLYDVNVHEVQRVILQSPTMKIEHVSWCSDGLHFMLSHADGAYSRWSSKSDVPVDDPNVIFGPFPCEPVRKILCTATTLGETILFTGGMPRASYGDRYTITAKRGDKVAVFDFSSPVLDFIAFPESCVPKSEEYHTGGFLVVLCEQEIVCMDLADKQWRQVPLLYLHPLHASQITTSTICANLEEHVWKQIEKAAELQRRHSSMSPRSWPFTAGNNEKKATSVAYEQTRQVLITGHENGSVRLWSASSITMQLMCTLKSAREFAGFTDEDDPMKMDEKVNRDSLYDSESSSEGNPNGEWPPFVKVGEYDPFCDDHKLAVQKIAFDGSTGQIAVGGRGGHVIVYHLTDCSKEVTVGAAITQPLVDESGLPHHIARLMPLPKRTGARSYEAGFQPYTNEGCSESVWLQLKPAVSVTALSLLSNRGLVAAGCEFGFTIVDLRTKQSLVATSLLSGQDLLEAGALDDALSRFKSMKKSIRQSFRRKRKTISNSSTVNTSTAQGSPAKTISVRETARGSPNTLLTENHFEEDDDEEVVRPVERRIEARSERSNAIDQPVWLIRVLRFAKTSMLSSTTVNDCLWVGSNGGRILCYVIALRDRAEDSCRLVREVRLQHAAPIIDIQVCVDPLSKSAFTGHRLVVFTEEQIRAFTLPHLKNTRYKYKLTAVEGERVRKASIVKLKSRSDSDVEELFAAVLSNLGNIFLFSLINPRKKVSANVLEMTDILGMSSCCISPSGELFYLRIGGSELQRASISYHSHQRALASPFQDKPFPIASGAL